MTTPEEHLTRVLTLVTEAGLEPLETYTAHNGVIRVRIAQFVNAETFAATRQRLTRLMVKHGCMYGISHAAGFIEQSDELTFRPPEGMR